MTLLTYLLTTSSYSSIYQYVRSSLGRPWLSMVVWMNVQYAGWRRWRRRRRRVGLGHFVARRPINLSPQRVRISSPASMRPSAAANAVGPGPARSGPVWSRDGSTDRRTDLLTATKRYKPCCDRVGRRVTKPRRQSAPVEHVLPTHVDRNRAVFNWWVPAALSTTSVQRLQRNIGNGLEPPSHVKISKVNGVYNSSQIHLTTTGTYVSYWIAQCYSRLYSIQPIKAGTRFSDPGGMQGRVDLVGYRLHTEH